MAIWQRRNRQGPLLAQQHDPSRTLVCQHACHSATGYLYNFKYIHALQLQVEELHGLLRPHLLRRLKADVLGSLPPKKEQIVRVELAAPQRALYKSLLTNSYQTLISGGCWHTA